MLILFLMFIFGIALVCWGAELKMQKELDELDQELLAVLRKYPEGLQTRVIKLFKTN